MEEVSKKPSPEQVLEQYIHISKYSRWRESMGRRELYWEETVNRWYDFWVGYLKNLGFTKDSAKELLDRLAQAKQFILDKKVMPSMRTLMTAGKALLRDEAAGFNCWAAAIDHPKVFDELFYLLMCGGGVGWSVERQYINKLPVVSEDMFMTDTVIVVADSKIGWAKALRELLALLWQGQIPHWDLSKVRPAGARLKTFGGRASGPEPLDRLFKFAVLLFSKASGRKLNSIEAHDLMCNICGTVIVGSVRRAAGISFSNLTDDRMRKAKSGVWWEFADHRKYANNSTAYTERPDLDSFLEELLSMYQAHSGERGVVNKVALRKKAEQCGREHTGDYLLNPYVPCGLAA